MKQVTIVGTGYVGLVSGAGISDFGNFVVCTDIAQDKINLLKSGKIPIYEPGLKEIVNRNVASGCLSFSTDVQKAIRNSKVIFIAVGTPEGMDGNADLSAVKAVAKTIGENLNKYKVICTKSTVPVGAGKLIQKIINDNNPNNVEFDYVSNPEFLREGAAVFDFMHPDRVVIGTTNNRALEIMSDVYRPLYINETPIVHTNVETAEMIKYASNAFLALKISYINEIANFCESVSADVHIVAKAMGKDGRISPKFLHPGPGFGGSCFPKDTSALVTMAEEHNVNINTVKAAIETNKAQKEIVIKKLKKLVGNHFEGKSIGIFGLSFKPETDDVRDSPAINLLKFLSDKGANIRAYDPIASENMSKLFPRVKYCKSWNEAAKKTEAVVIMTEWNEFRSLDLEELKIIMQRPVLIDTRNILSVEKLEKIGFKYENFGRMFLNS